MVDKAEAVLLVSVMLVAGKLATLTGRERKEKRAHIRFHFLHFVPGHRPVQAVIKCGADPKLRQGQYRENTRW